MVVKIGEQTWDVQGALAVHDLEQLVGVPLAEDGVTTTSGLVTRRLGGFPKVGDVLAVGPCELRVEEMDDTRVARLHLRRLPENQAPSSGRP
jgi:CBS domain containing-hemolysin-like protein